GTSYEWRFHLHRKLHLVQEHEGHGSPEPHRYASRTRHRNHGSWSHRNAGWCLRVAVRKGTVLGRFLARSHECCSWRMAIWFGFQSTARTAGIYWRLDITPG